MKHVGRNVNVLSQKMKRRIGRISLEYGISSMQAKILGYIYCNYENKDIFQKTIEEEFDIRRSSVTSVLTLMEKNNLIERISVREDARLKKLILTEKGIKIHKLVYKEIEEIETIIANTLNEDELERFNENLKRLIQKLDD